MQIGLGSKRGYQGQIANGVQSIYWEGNIRMGIKSFFTVRSIGL